MAVTVAGLIGVVSSECGLLYQDLKPANAQPLDARSLDLIRTSLHAAVEKACSDVAARMREDGQLPPEPTPEEHAAPAGTPQP